MNEKNIHSLLLSSLTGSELKIFFYIQEICNYHGFSVESIKSIAAFFGIAHDNIRKRVCALKKAGLIKTVSYNGRSGFMVDPAYCYQHPAHLRKFRQVLWETEMVTTRFKPRVFYGPPLVGDESQKSIINMRIYDSPLVNPKRGRIVRRLKKSHS